jgi:hypothetical protein
MIVFDLLNPLLYTAWSAKGQVFCPCFFTQRTGSEWEVSGAFNFLLERKLSKNNVLFSRQVRYVVLQSKDTDKAHATICDAWAREKLCSQELPLTSNPHDLLSSIINTITEKPVAVKLAARNESPRS